MSKGVVHACILGHGGRRRLRQPPREQGSRLGVLAAAHQCALAAAALPCLPATDACTQPSDWPPCGLSGRASGAGAAAAAAGPTLRMESACSSDTSLKSTSCSASVPTGTAASPAGGRARPCLSGPCRRRQPAACTAPPGHPRHRPAHHRPHPRREQQGQGRRRTVCRHQGAGECWFPCGVENWAAAAARASQSCPCSIGERQGPRADQGSGCPKWWEPLPAASPTGELLGLAREAGRGDHKAPACTVTTACTAMRLRHGSTP